MSSYADMELLKDKKVLAVVTGKMAVNLLFGKMINI